MTKVVNIFLDSTAIYSDPLFKNKFSNVLLELQSEQRVKIYISNIVFNESLNNYEKQLNEIYLSINKEIEKLNRITCEESENILKKYEAFIEYFKLFYDTKFNSGNFIRVEYEENLLHQLIQRSIKRIKPFTDSRQEFRDCIIWLSYVRFIKNNKLSNNYFITNNKRDFWDDSNSDLHPELRNEISDLKIYSNLQEFLSNEKEILNIFKERDFSDWLERQHFSNQIILSIIKNQLWEHLLPKINESIDKLHPQLYFQGTNAGYFEYSFKTENLKLGSYHVSQISNFAFIECKFLMEGLANIYPIDYVWTREKRNFTLKIDLSFTLDINMNTNDCNINKIEPANDQNEIYKDDNG